MSAHPDQSPDPDGYTLTARQWRDLWEALERLRASVREPPAIWDYDEVERILEAVERKP